MLALLAGIAVVALIPIAMKWSEKRGDPVVRVLRERHAAEDAVAHAAKQDLACDTIEIRQPGGELWAHGCGKRARYVPTPDGTFRVEGTVEKDEADSECTAVWSRELDAGDDSGAKDGGDAGAKDAVAKLHAAGKTARVRIPIAAFGVQGLAKLRYGEHVDARLGADAGAVPDAVPVPCIDPGADGGLREGRCTKEWDTVVEVAECR